MEALHDTYTDLKKQCDDVEETHASKFEELPETFSNTLKDEVEALKINLVKELSLRCGCKGNEADELGSACISEIALTVSSRSQSRDALFQMRQDQQEQKLQACLDMLQEMRKGNPLWTSKFPAGELQHTDLGGFTATLSQEPCNKELGMGNAYTDPPSKAHGLMDAMKRGACDRTFSCSGMNRKT